jgi:TonB family protein
MKIGILKFSIALLFILSGTITQYAESQDTPPTAPASSTAPASPTPPPAPAAPHYTPPQVVKQVMPTYPKSLKNSGITGKVSLEFFIETDGQVQEVRIIDSPHPLFSEAAIAAIKKWKFHPKLKDGVPVRARLLENFTFSLNQR